MSRYEFLLFAHISMAAIWVGGWRDNPVDVSLWIAVFAFAALAALLVRNGLNAQLAGTAAPVSE